MILFFVFLSVCFVGILLWFLQKILADRRGGKRYAGVSIRQSSANTLPATAESWFDDRVEQYKKEVLAYCIYEKAADLPAKDLAVLQNRYGTILFPPTIEAFEYGFQKQGLSARQLDELGVMWLKKNHVAADISNWEKSLDAFVLLEQQKKASDIVSETGNENESPTMRDSLKSIAGDAKDLALDLCDDLCKKKTEYRSLTDEQLIRLAENASISQWVAINAVFTKRYDEKRAENILQEILDAKQKEYTPLSDEQLKNIVMQHPYVQKAAAAAVLDARHGEDGWQID